MNVVDIVLKELEEAIDTRKNALVRGHIKDYAEYQHLVGVITGLTSASDRLKDLLKYEEVN
jgi:hypothetical protein